MSKIKITKQCKCISDLEKKMIGFESKGKKVTKAEFTSSGLMFSTMTRQACGEMELTVDGGKRPVKQSILYNYCPFCGEKYPESKS